MLDMRVTVISGGAAHAIKAILACSGRGLAPLPLPVTVGDVRL